ncbi:MAG: ATP-binding cassette domain-containing protein, partial [Gemmataceae bacterium]|nr:ATP-binding cassette domain-containing protein [Gemmataceae bacterium]
MPASTATDPPLLAARGVHKRFPGVYALRAVDLDVRAGEVHAVVGENGAGKSTLMHLLAGVYQPDGGRLEWQGRPVVFANERAATDAGVALVHQERSLFGPLSVSENVFAGRPPRTRWGTIDRRRLRVETERLLAEVGLVADPDTPVERLSPARQQLVEIAKALSLDARVIIFDEPTAALSLNETETLFGIIGGLRKRGVGIAYISHRLAEVFRIADRVTVLKDGAGQGTGPVAEATPAGLVARMVGR